MRSNKSKTLGKLNIPDEYFFDFLRGHFDGDGSFYSYWDLRWRSSFMFYITFISASKRHLIWLQNNLIRLLGVEGVIQPSDRTWILRFAKRESLKIICQIYHTDDIPCLTRKREKIRKALSIDEKNNADVEKLVNSQA